MTQENLKMYILVNDTLKMGKGKIASQVGHAVSQVTEHCVLTSPELWRTYITIGAPKIVLKATEEQMKEIILATQHMKYTAVIIDAGHTQIPSNSITTLAFLPCITYPHVLISTLKLL